jgi:hypothetical protein
MSQCLRAAIETAKARSAIKAKARSAIKARSAMKQCEQDDDWQRNAEHPK